MLATNEIAMGVVKSVVIDELEYRVNEKLKEFFKLFTDREVPVRAKEYLTVFHKYEMTKQEIVDAYPYVTAQLYRTLGLLDALIASFEPWAATPEEVDAYEVVNDMVRCCHLQRDLTVIKSALGDKVKGLLPIWVVPPKFETADEFHSFVRRHNQSVMAAIDVTAAP